MKNVVDRNMTLRYASREPKAENLKKKKPTYNDINQSKLNHSRTDNT